MHLEEQSLDEIMANSELLVSCYFYLFLFFIIFFINFYFYLLLFFLLIFIFIFYFFRSLATTSLSPPSATWPQTGWIACFDLASFLQQVAAS